MFIEEDTIDDLMREVFEKLADQPFNIKTTKGATSELFGVLLELKRPRARLSLSETRGKAFSALGELLWYLSGSNDLEFIKYYIGGYDKLSDDSKTIRGGYGPRLFNMREEINQIRNVISILKSKPTSRRATIQLFDASDLTKHDYKDIPCTCTLQFLIRDKKLNMYSSMRSNDAFLGLPHDIFCFTMIQEIMARTLNVSLGTYKHSVASLHLYKDKKEKSRQYIDEGYQSLLTAEMPKMPAGDPWNSIKILVEVEQKIRNGIPFEFSELEIDDYWLDLIKLIKIHSLVKMKKIEDIKMHRDSLSSNVYHRYIDEKIKF